jgi:peroxiredoxin
MMSRIAMCAMAAAAVLSLATVGIAADLSVGEKAPAFKDLPTTDGKKISLTDYNDAKAVVITFTCNNCPVAVAYQDRFIEFTKQYKDKGVAFVAINVNSGENLQKMKQRAEEIGFNFPYAYDESQETAKQYGAKVTPHMFVLNKNREVVYIGAFDDAQKEPNHHFVKEVVDTVLAGKKPEVKGKDAFGCRISYK